jgi:transposase-like protein
LAKTKTKTKTKTKRVAIIKTRKYGVTYLKDLLSFTSLARTFGISTKQAMRAFKNAKGALQEVEDNEGNFSGTNLPIEPSRIWTPRPEHEDFEEVFRQEYMNTTASNWPDRKSGEATIRSRAYPSHCPKCTQRTTWRIMESIDVGECQQCEWQASAELLRTRSYADIRAMVLEYQSMNQDVEYRQRIAEMVKEVKDEADRFKPRTPTVSRRRLDI